jgi:hypothetical protein
MRNKYIHCNIILICNLIPHMKRKHLIIKNRTEYLTRMNVYITSSKKILSLMHSVTVSKIDAVFGSKTKKK